MGKNVIISTLPNISQNYLPKVNTSNIFANSLVYDNGTSVMIDTTTTHSSFANARLVVNRTGNSYIEIRAISGQSALALTTGTSSASATPTVEFFNSGNFGIVAYRPGVVSSNYLMYYNLSSSTNRYLAIQTEGQDRITINQNGTIDLTGALSGTSATFSGDLLVKNTSTLARIDIEAPSANSKNIFFKSTGNADNSVRLAQNANTNDFIIATGDGTVTPTTRLTISSTGAATFSGNLETQTNGNSPQFRIKDTDFTGQGAYGYMQVQNGSLYIGNATDTFGSLSDKLIISSTGAATFSSSVTLSSTGNSFVVLDNTTATTGKQWRVSSGSNGNFYITQVGVIDALIISPTTGAATFSSSVTAVTGNFSGNVTIAKTTPGLILNGLGSGNSGAYINLQGWAATNKNWQIGVANIGPSGLLFSPSTTAGGTTFSSGVIAFSEAGSISLDGTLTAGGNVRSVRVFTNSGGNSTDPIIAPADDTNNGIFFPSADTFAITTAGTERMRITSGGNVGIGTAFNITPYFESGQTSGVLQTATNISKNSTASTNSYPLAFFGSNDASQPLGLYIGMFTGSTNAAKKLKIQGTAIGITPNDIVINSDGGNVIIGTTNENPAENNVKGISFFPDGRQFISSDNNEVMRINRKTSDGVLVYFHQDGVVEGNISVSGTTVSYNGGHLARYSQTESGQRVEGLLKGTVMSNLDKMAEWINSETRQPYANEQLNCMKISDVEGDVNVAGVFVNWDEDDKTFTNDMNIAMTGDMIIRIAKDVVVEKGQLLMSAGDGTAKPQGDDIIKSKTIAKVTSNHVTCVYEDGSYCVPCVLMAC